MSHRGDFGTAVGSLIFTLVVGRLACATDEARPSSDPHALSGTWFVPANSKFTPPYFTPVDGGELPLTAEGKATFERRKAAETAGAPIADPATVCWPHGVPMITATPTPFQIVQAPGEVAFVYEAGHDYRVVHLDEAQSKDTLPSFMGHSVGHWEGDTLVIDTTGRKIDSVLDYNDHPISIDAHVVERYRKIDGGRKLENLITVTDTKNYTHPWTARREYLWAPGERVEENICEENERLEPNTRRLIAD